MGKVADDACVDVWCKAVIAVDSFAAFNGVFVCGLGMVMSAFGAVPVEFTINGCLVFADDGCYTGDGYPCLQEGSNLVPLLLGK